MLLSPELDAALAGLVGLLIGSFLNVVVYRLPVMMERQWAQECAALHDGTAFPADLPATATATGGNPAAEAPRFDLSTPRSRCTACGHPIAWHENIPVVSWLLLRGRCSACHAAISARYPLVEVASAALFAYCAWRWGIANPTAWAWCAYGAVLLTLGLIDWDTTLLPDDLTLPLVWSGLIVAALGWTQVALSASLWGAVAGYLSLWLVYWGFKLLTGKEGMGYGDFKLFAALGAWFGWQALVPLILVASVVGAAVGIAMKLRSQLREGGYVPFGPFLAASGVLAMVWGPEWVLRLAGL